MKKILYDVGVILCIALILPVVAVWAGIVSMYYTCINLPQELLELTDKMYYND
jgi:hypothetical protein